MSSKRTRKSRSSRSSGAADMRKLNPLRAKSDFICRYKCTNNLPDVPQPPKLLQYPFDPMRYIRRGPSTTALEESYSQTAPILAEPDLGVPIDLIDPEQYTVTGQEPPLNELDRELIEGQEAKKSSGPAAPMPWFLQTYYVDPLAKEAAKNTTWEDDMLSPGRKEQMASEASVDTRIQIVEKTFAEAAELGASGNEGLQHKQKRGVHAVEVTEFLPDVERWGVDLVHTSFDDAPPNQLSEKQAKGGVRIKEGGMPMIQGLSSETGMWMAYMVPTTKRKAEEAGAEAEAEPGAAEPVHYRRLRSYNHEDVSESDEAKKTHLVYRPGGSGPYFYKKFASHFRLRKRLRTDEEDDTAADRDNLTVVRRDPDEEELEDAAAKREEITEVYGAEVESASPHTPSVLALDLSV